MAACFQAGIPMVITGWDLAAALGQRITPFQIYL